MSIESIRQSLKDRAGSYWDIEFENGSDDLDALISYANAEFERHKPPYQVYITDNEGNIVIFKEKR